MTTVSRSVSEPAGQTRPTRVLLAKPGLDGHDRGALVISRALRGAGFEVIYTGRRQAPEQIAAAAVQEDVDIVGLSILSGAHIDLSRKVLAALAARGAEDIPVVVGGTLLKDEEAQLRVMGVAATFPTGMSLADCVAGMAKVAADRKESA